MEDLVVTQRVTIPASELSWTAVASGGPGGQHVNKVSTKVALRWALASSEVLVPWARARLEHLAARHIDASGSVQVVSDATRSQRRNLDDARERLAALVREALERPKPRRKTKPSRAAKRRRLEDKRRHSEKKAARRPPHD